MQSWIFRAVAAASVTVCTFGVLPVCAQVGAASAPQTTAVQWQVSAPAGSALAYFSNLKAGDRIETPFLVQFGLSGGWGLAPISVASGGKSGHHHLLINRDLPLDFKKPLPFNEQYIHFGKGQMEGVLTMPPGDYTLRLLLADDKHLPHFVYSKPIKITVARKNEGVDPKTLAVKGIRLGLDQVSTKAPFRVRFHASNLNVAHAAQKAEGTGHFRLTMTPKIGGKPVGMDFPNGQTEVWLQPPAGEYTLRLDLVDNLNAGATMAPSVSASVTVL